MLLLSSLMTANASAAPVKEAAPVGTTGLVFGVYAGGGAGDVGAATAPDMRSVLERTQYLRGDASLPFNVHLFTSWTEYDEYWIGQELDRYAAAGLHVTLTLKYLPPPGHDGD